MMPSSQLGNIIVVLVTSAVISAQSDTFPAKSQNRVSAPDARQIMEASIAVTQRQWQARLHYTYLERDENRRWDLAGHVESEDDRSLERSWSMVFHSISSSNVMGGLPRLRRNGNKKTSSTS